MGDEGEMGGKLSQFGCAHLRSRRFAVLALLVIAVLTASCSTPPPRSDDNRQGGFYGGVTGGRAGY
jgi:hypothetical protein